MIGYSDNLHGNEKRYRNLCLLAEGLLEDEDDLISAMANLSALIWQQLPDLNWAGFYRASGSRLILGPFQGKPACNRIEYGKGVCGSAWAQNRILLVRDVHAFPGHIACDAASNSEIVLPYHTSDGKVAGVLDIDSPLPARFNETDSEGLSQLVLRFEFFMRTMR